MQIQTAELTGFALNWIVGVIEHEWSPEDAQDWVLDPYLRYEPSDNVAEGRQIMTREGISVSQDKGSWTAIKTTGDQITSAHGETELVAGMRCYVLASKGAEIDIPDALLDSDVEEEHNQRRYPRDN